MLCKFPRYTPKKGMHYLYSITAIYVHTTKPKNSIIFHIVYNHDICHLLFIICDSEPIMCSKCNLLRVVSWILSKKNMQSLPPCMWKSIFYRVKLWIMVICKHPREKYLNLDVGFEFFNLQKAFDIRQKRHAFVVITWMDVGEAAISMLEWCTRRKLEWKGSHKNNF